MIYSKICLTTEQELKPLQCPITSASINVVTNIIGICTNDSSIILSNISNTTSHSSSVQLSIEHISNFLWLNNYEFLVSGTGGDLVSYSIMNLAEESFNLHTSGITAMKKKDFTIFTGSSDGSISTWDSRSKLKNYTFQHNIKGKIQPIKSLDTSDDNYLYSSTVYKGMVWLWDIRAIKKPIKVIETNKVQNYLHWTDRCIFSSNSAGILRISHTLQLTEQMHSLENVGKIKYSKRFESLLFSDKANIYLKSIERDGDFTCKEEKGILGFELFDSNRILQYFSSGKVSISKIELKNKIITRT